MLKIYRAYIKNQEFMIEDSIKFKNGRFDTGHNGFGMIISNYKHISEVNYELQTLKSFREYIKTVKKNDGYVDNFTIWNPITYKGLEEKYKDISKNSDEYEKYRLNEEAIILFTDNIFLKYPLDDSVQKIFGRHPENGMYLIMPGASFSMTKFSSFCKYNEEKFEVLQSKNLGKQLVLSKMSRNI